MEKLLNGSKGNKKLKLGKGIASLIGDIDANDETDMELKDFGKRIASKEMEKKETPSFENTMIPLSLIDTNPQQPRKIFKEKDLKELADSIKENGLIQPIVVSHKEDGRFELISGERRFRASQSINLEQVPVVVKRVTTKDKLVLAIIENVQRSDLNCIEEALAYYQLMDEFKLTQEEVAKKIGKERSTIANFLRILRLPRAVVEMLQREELSFGHGKILATVKEEELVKRLARTAIEDGLSVRSLEALIKKSKTTKERNPSSKEVLAEQYNSLRETLERRTGYQFKIKPKKNGSGELVIKFNNEAEFNDIYEFLVK